MEKPPLSSLANRRPVLRQQNISLWHHRSEPSNLDFLDGSLKKNSAFIKRLKTLNADNYESILSDFYNLKLTKFITEAASCLASLTPTSNPDIMAVLELGAAFHTVYDDFADYYYEALVKNLSLKAETDVNDTFGQKAFFRMIIEGCIVGLFRNDTVVYDTLRSLFEKVAEPSTPKMISLANYFLKALKPFLIDNQDGAFAPEISCKISELFVHFYKACCRTLIRAVDKLGKMETRSKIIYETKGDLSDKQSNLLNDTKGFIEETKKTLKPLSEFLDLPFPNIAESESNAKISEGKIVFANLTVVQGESNSTGPFEGSEESAFYENIPSIAELVPGELIPASTTNQNVIVDSDDIDMEEMDPDKDIACVENIDEYGSATSTKSPFSLFLGSLSQIYSAATADKLSVDYLYICKKSNRKVLAEHMLLMTKNRSDLIPFFGRILAAWKTMFPDIILAVNNSLLGQFKFLTHRAEPIRGTRFRICCFIGELVKFKVMGQGQAFACLKRLTDDFNLYNIDMACMLLEYCGRFLYFQPESRNRIENICYIMRRKKMGLNVDQNRLLQIENALYLVNPPATSKLEQPELPMHELFARKFIWSRLEEDNVDIVFKALRSLPWADHQVRKSLLHVLSRTWKVREASLGPLASLVSGLQKIRFEFVADLVDEVIEVFFQGLASNYPLWGQRRISNIIFIGHLYSFQVVESDVIFVLLWSLLSTGHPNGIARVTEPISEDPPADVFRIALVISLLNTCGIYFSRGAEKESLRAFLDFFQYYIFTKPKISSELENALDDLFDALDVPTIYSCPQDCINALIARNGPQLAFLLDDFANDHSLSDSADATFADNDEEEAIEEEEFERMLSGAVAESLEARKLDYKPKTFDASVPYAMQSAPTSTSQAGSSGGVPVRMLLKRKNKVAMREIVLPLNPKLLSSIEEERKINILEKERAAKKTLDSQKEEDDMTLESNDNFLQATQQPAPPSRTPRRKNMPMWKRGSFMRRRY